MSGTKSFVNNTGVDLRITLFVRDGSDPTIPDSGRQNFKLAADAKETITYGEETGDVFLNAIRLRWEEDGAALTYIMRVDERGSWADDLMNTNNVITFEGLEKAKISGSNNSEAPSRYFQLTSRFLESKNLFLEGNGGLSGDNTLGGAAFMSPQSNATGTFWKMIPLDNGYFQLTTFFMEKDNVVLEGNGGFDAANTLGGSAFLSGQTNATGTMWKMIPLDNGYFQLTSRFLEDKGLVLEGNGGLDPANTLGGAAFMSGQTNATGTMWKMIPVKLKPEQRNQ